MNFSEIMQLVKFLNKSELTEFRVKDGEFELQVRTRHFTKSKILNAPQPFAAAPVVQHVEAPKAVATTPSEPAKPEAPKEKETNNFIEIKSPMVGTFYRSPAPDKPPYVKVGDTVQVGDTVCIIEAMKLFNEIESEVTGKIVKVMVEDACPVEYDQVLFLVEPA